VCQFAVVGVSYHRFANFPQIYEFFVSKQIFGFDFYDCLTFSGGFAKNTSKQCCTTLLYNIKIEVFFLTNNPYIATRFKREKINNKKGITT